MADLVSPAAAAVAEGKAVSGFDPCRIAIVNAWLAAQFDAAGKGVPDFEYNPRVVAHLHSLASLSQSKTRAAEILAADFHLKASEYRSQAARVKEILEHVGLPKDSLSSNAALSVQVLANLAKLLHIRDTEMTSYLVAAGDIVLRKTVVEEKRTKVQKESKALLDYTRQALARLTYLKRTLSQLDSEVATCEDQMLYWKKNLALMVSKEQQYIEQNSVYKAILNRVGYSPEISHGVLTEMSEQKKDLEKKTKPILDTLRSYQDLPPDKALAALAIEAKRQQYADAEKLLEEVLHSALTTND